MVLDTQMIPVERRQRFLDERKDEITAAVAETKTRRQILLAEILIPELLERSRAPFTTSPADDDNQRQALALLHRILCFNLDLQQQAVGAAGPLAADVAEMFVRRMHCVQEIERIYASVQEIGGTSTYVTREEDVRTVGNYLAELAHEAVTRQLSETELKLQARLNSDYPLYTYYKTLLSTETSVFYIYLRNRLALAGIRHYASTYREALPTAGKIGRLVTQLESNDREYHQAVFEIAQMVYSNLSTNTLPFQRIGAIMRVFISAHEGYKEKAKQLNFELDQATPPCRQELQRLKLSPADDINYRKLLHVVGGLVKSSVMFLSTYVTVVTPLVMIDQRDELAHKSVLSLKHFGVAQILLLLMLLDTIGTHLMFLPPKFKYFGSGLIAMLAMTGAAEIALLAATPMLVAHYRGNFTKIDPYTYTGLSLADRKEIGAVLAIAMLIKVLIFTIQAVSIHRAYRFSPFLSRHWAKYSRIVRGGLIGAVFSCVVTGVILTEYRVSWADILSVFTE